MTSAAAEIRQPRRRRGLGPRTRAFFAAPSGIFAVVILALLAFFAAFGPLLFGDQATTLDFTQTRQGPSWDHLLGTDAVGRDILARILYGTRLSLGIGLGAAALAFGLGILMGAGATLLPGRGRSAFLRFIDTMISFPGLLKAIVIGVIVGIGAQSVILGIGVAGSFGFARTTSTLALSIGGREYINAARVVGVKGRRLMFRYILPNIAEPLLLFLGIAIGVALLGAAGLSFLGLGVQQPSVDWGRMLIDGVHDIYTAPAGAIGPAAAIAISALAFAYAGEAAARAVNPLVWTAPKEKRRERPAPDRPALSLTDAPVTNGRAPEVTEAPDGPAPPIDPDAALEVRDLVVTFPGPGGTIEIVKGISFTVGRGEMVGIVGESGSGKTMTALSVAQLTPYPGRATGTVLLHGYNPREIPRSRLPKFMGTNVGFVFQDPMSALNPALTVGRQLTEAARTHRGLDRRQARDLAAARLAEVHIPAPERQLKRYPHEFSGGMRQRAMIAMGLMNEPSLLICDEPTTALDVTIQAQIMDLLNEVNQTHGTAIVLISHNLALVSQNCHRVLVMYAGRIVEELDADQLTTDPKHPYTRALLGAVPEFGHERGEPLAYIPGETPDIGSPPPGCPYHPRCPLAVDRCRTERPQLVTRPGERNRRVACHVANDDLAA
jgi:oligopeptide/dipeptide ABC transporter ATP-binding protein